MMPVQTPEYKRIVLGALEPVYAPATHLYNESVIGRVVQQSIVEGLVKNNYPYPTAPGFHETIQSTVARVRPTTEAINAQMANTGVYPLLPGG